MDANSPEMPTSPNLVSVSASGAMSSAHGSGFCSATGGFAGSQIPGLAAVHLAAAGLHNPPSNLLGSALLSSASDHCGSSASSPYNSIYQHYLASIVASNSGNQLNGSKDLPVNNTGNSLSTPTSVNSMLTAPSSFYFV